MADQTPESLTQEGPVTVDSTLVELVRVFRNEKFMLYYGGGKTHKGRLQLTSSGLRFNRGHATRPKYREIPWNEVESLALLGKSEGINTRAIALSALTTVFGMFIVMIVWSTSR